jgi:ribosome-associated protein
MKCRCGVIPAKGTLRIEAGVRVAEETGLKETRPLELRAARSTMSGRDIALFAARMADDKKGENIIIYDLRGLTDLADYFVIVTAKSKAQVRAIVESIALDLKKIGTHKYGQEGNENGQWILLDYADCVIHIFSPALRDYYGLESLWGDAPRVDWTAAPVAELKTGS